MPLTAATVPASRQSAKLISWKGQREVIDEGDRRSCRHIATRATEPCAHAPLHERLTDTTRACHDGNHSGQPAHRASPLSTAFLALPTLLWRAPAVLSYLKIAHSGLRASIHNWEAQLLLLSVSLLVGIVASRLLPEDVSADWPPPRFKTGSEHPELPGPADCSRPPTHIQL